MAFDRRQFLVPAFLALALSVATAGAHDYKQGQISIDHPWSRATAPGQSTGAGYLVLRNGGSQADRLTGASSPASGRVEMHTHSIDYQGIARMRQVPSVEIPADGEARFEPGGLHLMLIDLKEPLANGKQVPLTLSLEKAGTVEVMLTVEQGRPPAQHSSGHTH